MLHTSLFPYLRVVKTQDYLAKHSGEQCGKKRKCLHHEKVSCFTKLQIFKCPQIESSGIQTRCGFDNGICSVTGRKHCRKRRRGCLPAFSPTALQIFKISSKELLNLRIVGCWVNVNNLLYYANPAKI